MNDETKKILKEKTHVELKASDKQAVLEQIIGQQMKNKPRLLQHLVLPAGLVAGFLVALVFFQSKPVPGDFADLENQINTYLSMEKEFDDLATESMVYTEFQFMDEE